MKQFIQLCLKIISPLLLLWFILTPGFNFIFDPYGLLSNPHHSYLSEPNMRSIKRDLVSKSKSRKSLLLFSNSRGGIYESYREDFYNMSYSGGMPEEFLEDLIFLHENDRAPDSVILFLDEKAIYSDYRSNWKKPVRRLYNLDDYFEILTIPFSYRKIIPHFTKRNDGEKYINFHLDTDGHYEYMNFELTCRLDSVNLNFFLEHRSISIEKAEDAWLNLLSFLDQNEIHYSLYIHPLALTSVENFKYKVGDLNALISSLKSKGVVFENDICVLNDRANFCFHDNSHYSGYVGNLILQL